MTVGALGPTPAWTIDPASPPVTAAVDELVGRCLAEPERFGRHLALVVVHRGRLVAERYGSTADAGTALVSWSMGKSVTHALVGLCVRDGLLALHEPAPVPAWAADERATITLDQLLAMCDGLDFREEYVDAGASDVIEMLFGSGRDDVAAFAAARPAIHPPGTRWNYSSGTTNVVAALVTDAVAARAGVSGAAGRRAAFEAWCRAELFDPLGMPTAAWRYDAAGTFVGSSFLYAPAREFARFGQLYLHDGTWNGRRLLPEGWAAHARLAPMAPVPVEEGRYGRHWWLLDDVGLGDTYGAHGYEGQYTWVCPSRDLVVVRLGKTDAEQRLELSPLLRAVVSAFDTSESHR